jgi:hypothetical protein
MSFLCDLSDIIVIPPFALDDSATPWGLEESISE